MPLDPPFQLNVCRGPSEVGNISFLDISESVVDVPRSFIILANKEFLTGVWLGYPNSVCTGVTEVHARVNESTLATELIA